MKSKKIIRLWQMIAISILLVAMIVTMFLPAFHIDGNAVVESMKITSREMFSGGFELLDELAGGIADAQYQKLEEETNEKIKEYEEKFNINISNISPFYIMTGSLEQRIWGDEISNVDIEAYQKVDIYLSIQKIYNTIRIFLWIVYSLAFILLLLIILSFFLKWNKLISLISVSVYGVASAALFGYLRFGLAGYIESVIGDVANLGNKIMGAIFEGYEATFSVSKIIPCFYSLAFLLAFIVSLLIVISSIVSMFLGNRKVIPEKEVVISPGSRLEVGNPDSWNVKSDLNHDTNNLFVEPNFSMVNTQAKTLASQAIVNQNVMQVTNGQKMKTPIIQKQAPMGQVKCTKGVAMGQGVMLPQDRKVIVGKSPASANLVIHNQHISNIHCSIRYIAETNNYIVKDHSTNGTFVNGMKLPNNVEVQYPSGTVISLADGSNEITLG